eukprot:10809337-Alexandrium_andersonii.AAC.1
MAACAGAAVGWTRLPSQHLPRESGLMGQARCTSQYIAGGAVLAEWVVVQRAVGATLLNVSFG